MNNYSEFLQSKVIKHQPSGFGVDLDDLNPMLFDWQKVLSRWALYKGKAALFEDCGLGKTPQQLEWARCVHAETGGDILILAPLAVAKQTQREGLKFGIAVTVCYDQSDVRPGINITNYERLHRFNPGSFIGVVLDESSILKNFAGKIRNQIITAFRDTPYKLCCTATPSPNDFTELGNTAEFLGVMTMPEMLAMFFINDTGKTGTWRLKGHIKENLFWEWLCSWAVMIQKPSDIGYSDDGFILPELNMIEHRVPYTGPRTSLFIEEALTLAERRVARKESIVERCDLSASIANKNGDIHIVWCGLNAESEMLKSVINGAVEIKGADTAEHKEKSMMAFSNNELKALVTKPKISGFGLNWQNCSNMIFCGISDSYEQLYQAVRRCWRFGQKKPVNVHIVISEREGAVLRNIQRKEKQMQDMFSGMVAHVSEILKSELSHHKRTTTPYVPKIDMKIPRFMETK